MTRTEDRLADALQAAADTVREGSVRPLAVPEYGQRRPQTHRPAWLAPVAAAAGVALVVGLAVLGGRLTAGHRGAPAAAAAGAPRYYLEVGLDGGRPVIRSTATGQVAGTVPVPAIYGNEAYDVAAADATRTWYLAAFVPGGRGERLYQFRLTQAGRVTGFQAVPGGWLAGRQWGADALAVSPDGSHIAVSMSFLGSLHSCGGQGRHACPRPRSDYIMAINTATGKRTVWQNTTGRPGHSFAVESLSWTQDNRELVFLGQWCKLGISNQTCVTGPRVAEIRALDPASGGGPVDSGRLLLRQSARFPAIMQALISPDGASITALVLHGRYIGSSQISGSFPGKLSVVQISAVTGQPLAVLYQRDLGNTSEINASPDALALGQDASGQHLILNIGLCAGNCTSGADGWINNGHLVPLTPADGREATQAW